MTIHAALLAPDFEDRALGALRGPSPGHGGAVPPGLALAQWLRAALLGAGHHISSGWSTDYSHAFEIVSGTRRFDVMVARGESEGRFEIMVEARRGLLPWSRRPDPVGERAVCRAIDSACRADPRISELRWHGVDEWPDGLPPPAPAATA